MAADLNKVQLIGRLGRDPEIRTLNSGEKVANLSVATSEKWNDRNGQKQERTEWHRVVVWGKLAGIVEQYLQKGAQVYLEGELQTRKWQDQGGQERYTTEVVLRQFGGRMQMLGGTRQGGGGQSGGYQQGDDGYGGQQQGRAAPPPNDLDDDIPF